MQEKSFWQRQSLLEKSFWITIVVLLLVVIVLALLGQNNLKEFGTREGIISAKQIEENLLTNKDALHKSFALNTSQVKQNIDDEIDRAFVYAFANVDSYLDWHYSIIGEYMQLGKLATGQLSAEIKRRLLGSDFNEKLQEASSHIQSHYAKSIDAYYARFREIALQGIDQKTNSVALHNINADTDKFLTLQKGKAGVAGVGLSAALLTKLSLRMAAKIVTKVAAKTAAKSATKVAASSSAALAGISCGPAAPLCGVGFALAAWFGVDAAYISVDEALNRNEMRAELMAQLTTSKIQLKKSYTVVYAKHFQTIHNRIKKEYSTIETKKTIRESIWR